MSINMKNNCYFVVKLQILMMKFNIFFYNTFILVIFAINDVKISPLYLFIRCLLII